MGVLQQHLRFYFKFSYNDKILFKVECEQDRNVPFLDTKLIRAVYNIIRIDWYGKSLAKKG